MQPYVFLNRFVGYAHETTTHFYFFGARGLTRADLPIAFPQYRFAFLKQIHSARVVPADPAHEPEADALYTSEPGVAVVAQSADCVPILLSSPTLACAIHSGWRGVAQNIVQAAAGAGLKPDRAFVGPHIQQKSFAVGLDVAAELDRAVPGGPRDYAEPKDGKVLYDLNRLVLTQIKHAFGPIPVENLPLDSRSDPRFCSFRRDKAEAGRQYSFAVVKTASSLR